MNATTRGIVRHLDGNAENRKRSNLVIDIMHTWTERANNGVRIRHRSLHPQTTPCAICGTLREPQP